MKTILLIWLATISLAICATARWDPNPEPDIAGYRLRYGLTEELLIVKDVGNVTTYVVDGLQEGETYYFTVEAYNTAGVSSEQSDMLTYKVPVTAPPPPVGPPAPPPATPKYAIILRSSGDMKSWRTEAAYLTGLEPEEKRFFQNLIIPLKEGQTLKDVVP